MNFPNLCDEVGKSPNAVASECGVKSSGTVTGWTQEGAIPRIGLMKKLAEYFTEKLGRKITYTKYDLIDTEKLSDEKEKKEKPTADKGDGLSDFDKMLLNETEDFSDEERKMVNDYVLFVRSLRKP